MISKTHRILVVEDDAIGIVLIQDSLATLGADFEIEAVTSGDQALEKIGNCNWDLVVTDYQIPGMTGLDVIKTLKVKTPAALAILITAYASDEIEAAAHHLQVYRYMPKPFSLGHLKQIVQYAFALPGYEKQVTSLSEPPPVVSPYVTHNPIEKSDADATRNALSG